MNCEKCQELISDLLDGSLTREDELTLNLHLGECLRCADVRNDLQSIVSFCQTHRGEYVAPPNERALWLRIRNVVELDRAATVTVTAPKPAQRWAQWFNRSWQLSLPQLAASVAALVLVVSLSTAVGLRRLQSSSESASAPSQLSSLNAASNVLDRTRQQQQMIDYWNQRVEMNKARWSPQMRATFDRNLKVIDQAVNTSLNELQANPHDEVSEEMLNAALNEKLAILKEFADL
jgi:Putative zinc-finger